MRGLWVTLVCVVLAGAAQAQSFESCTKPEIAYAQAAMDGADAIATRGAAMVGETPEYVRWFGTFDKARAERVRHTLKAIDTALNSDRFIVLCASIGEEDCDTGTYANVAPDRPYRVNLCPAFFRMPSMLGVVRDSGVFDSGTREGTLIHELSHFDVVGGTDDICYGREICEETARTDPDAAVMNADNYQYFAEDITFAYPVGAP